MKKIIAIILAALLILSMFAACASKSEPTTPTEEPTTTTEEPTTTTEEPTTTTTEEPTTTTEELTSEELLGGFTISEDTYAAALPEDAQKAFDEALSEIVGVGYEPIALLGTQVVAGTNYMIFCKMIPVAPDANPSYAVLEIYEDLDGNASLTKVTDFDLTAYVDDDDASDGAGDAEVLDGGWFTADFNAATLSDDLQEVFDAATGTMTGASYTPVAVLASQVVAGTNYAFLCGCTTATEESSNSFVVMTIYDGIDGSREILYINGIDLESFTE